MFVSHCTDALMASVFVTIYIIVYSTQSPNIALLSCLLQTLGIVNCFMLNILSCLLQTLVVWYLATVARNLHRAFYNVPQTYRISLSSRKVSFIKFCPVWNDELLGDRIIELPSFISSRVLKSMWHILLWRANDDLSKKQLSVQWDLSLRRENHSDIL